MQVQVKYARKADATKGVLYRINVEQDIDEEVAKTVEQRLRELMPKNKCVIAVVFEFSGLLHASTAAICVE